MRTELFVWLGALLVIILLPIVGLLPLYLCFFFVVMWMIAVANRKR